MCWAFKRIFLFLALFALCFNTNAQLTRPGNSIANAITNITSPIFTISLGGNASTIGATTDTPQFARLGLGTAADGTASLKTAGAVYLPNGTAAAPTLSFGDTTTGFYRPGANVIGIAYSGTDRFRFDAGGAWVNDNAGSVSWGGGRDLYLNRDAAATLQLGNDGASVVTPQTIKAADGSGTDKAGADFQVEGGQSTGTGRAGAVILRTGETLTTGSSANAYITRFYLSAKPVDLTGGTATLVFNVSLASGKTAGIHVFATTRVDDGTDFQGATDDFTCIAVNKAGTVSIGSISTSLGSTVATSGTISTVWTAVANGSGIDIKCNETTTVITPTTRRVRWRVETDSNDTGLTITPQ